MSGFTCDLIASFRSSHLPESLALLPPPPPPPSTRYPHSFEKMFAMFKICTVLALAAPFASALQITSVTGNAVSEGSLTIQWSTSTSDPSNTFSVELIHASFNAELALANNVDSSSLSLTVELNNIPVGDGYTIAFVDISDVNTVFTQSEDFSIGPVSQTQSVTVTGSASSSVKSSASKSASASGSGSASSGVALS
ncbi:hypothetical protein C8R47DRAFT_154080 [Mycena vitilis]|nr:hypothetical protein C8R47DRAFT_154080 [Mycena vitilis]